MEEIWKDIPGYEGYYQVSNMGRVSSVKRIIPHNSKDGRCILRTIRPRIIKMGLNCNGYYSLMLHKNGNATRFTVHRLVANAFLGNPDDGMTVNHKNGVRTDNRVENLEWCSQSDNILHASRILHTLTYHGKAVRCVETGEEFKSIKEAARHYGVADTNLGNSIRGKRQKRCAGYHWEFIS